MKGLVRRSVVLGTVPLGIALGLGAAPGVSNPAPAVSNVGDVPRPLVTVPVIARLLAPPRPVAALAAYLDPTEFGRSGVLRVRTANPGESLGLRLSFQYLNSADVVYRWLPIHGTRSTLPITELPLAEGIRAPVEPGAWRLRLRSGDLIQEVSDLTLIVRVPFAAKQGGRINGYRIGTYATELSGRMDEYAPPAGFIEVTPENQDMKVSENLRLRQFLTKNQFGIWPKYVALDLRLVDKLELVMQELNGMGIPARHMVVMSGFRTPEYNGPGEGGRAKMSRHTYGDASDVWVDNDGDNYIDDLNGDGRRDVLDAAVMRVAADRVEARYPELLGGNGVYTHTSAHGPFIHIDVRGSRARW